MAWVFPHAWNGPLYPKTPINPTATTPKKSKSTKICESRANLLKHATIPFAFNTADQVLSVGYEKERAFLRLAPI